MLKRSFIHDLIGRVKVEEVVGRYVALKRSGSSLRGLCPFHSETTPSFYVNPGNGLYYCFGCRKGGNAIKFLQEIEGRSFIDVVRELAEKEGMTLPQGGIEEGAEVARKERYERKARLSALLRAAAEAYEKCLWNSQAGEKGRAYLAQRGVTVETARMFHIGFAPEGGVGIAAIARSVGASIQDAVEVGLLRPGRNGTTYELFRGRLVFPVIVPGGQVVGFSGRALPGTAEEKVKYLNSPDSHYFHKGEILFGLAQALTAIRRAGSITLVEGNFDLVAMHQAGFQNSAAPLGSALTQRHIQIIKRFDVGITLLFDGDEAGLKAALRAFEIIVPYNLPTRIALLPPGEDPASLLARAGREGMEKVLAASQDMTTFVIRRAAKVAGDGDVGRVKALRELWNVLGRSPDGLVRAEVLKRLSQEFRMSEREVRKYLGFRDTGGGAKIAEFGVRGEGEGLRGGKGGEVEAGICGTLRKEIEVVIGAAIDFPQLAEELSFRGAEVIEDFAARSLLHAIASRRRADTGSGVGFGGSVRGPTGAEDEWEMQGLGVDVDIEGICAAAGDGPVREWVMRKIMGQEVVQFRSEAEARKAALESLSKLEREKIDREIKAKTEEANQAKERGDFAEFARILMEQQKLRKRAKKILY